MSHTAKNTPWPYFISRQVIVVDPSIDGAGVPKYQVAPLSTLYATSPFEANAKNLLLP